MTEKRSRRGPRIEVGVVMGSESDRPTLEEAVRVLDEFGIGSELVVRSAHRAPEAAARWAQSAAERGLRVIIAGAGGAAHLAGAMAAHSRLPVLGVPLASSPLGGFDALLSTVQMPPGVPVGTLGVGSWGARNAAHLAVRILALSDPSLMRRIEARAGGPVRAADAGRARGSQDARRAAPGRRGAAGKRPPGAAPRE